MSGSDDGRGNSEEREGGPPARVLPGGQIVQPGQVDRLPNIEQSTLSGDPEGCICPQDYVKAGCPVHDPDRTYYAKPVEAAPCPHCAGAVSSWPSARNVIEAVREGRLGLDALREVVTILDIHLGGQPEPSAPWPAWADHMRPRGPVVTRFVAFWKDPYRGWRLALIGPLVALLLLVQEALWAVSERIFGWRNH